MHFDHITQAVPGNISVEDETTLYAEPADCITSGRYTVAMLQTIDNSFVEVTLVGKDGTPTAGHITVVNLE